MRSALAPATTVFPESWRLRVAAADPRRTEIWERRAKKSSFISVWKGIMSCEILALEEVEGNSELPLPYVVSRK